MTEQIEVFTQSSIRIRAQKGTIYIDPFQMKTKPQDANFIFITHDHYDHYSPEDIQKVAGWKTILVVPKGLQKQAQEVAKLVSRIEVVGPGEKREINGLKIETVPSYNLSKAYHPKKAGWVGYILTIEGKRIYIAGDTDATKEAKAVECDIALVPIGGTFTMDAKEAADLINTIRPEVAIPTHYGSIVGKKEDAKTFQQKVKAPVEVEIKIP